MNVIIKITNEKKYNELVNDIEISGLSGMSYPHEIIKGNLTIELSDGDMVESWGEFGSNDYEEDYGFIFEIEE